MNRADHFLPELERLAAEVNVVYDVVVRPGWMGQQHGMPDTLFGYIMCVFARIDLYSAHWRGTFGAQSDRMVSFLCEYAHPDRLANSIAVQIWRHKLMHTSAPRPLSDHTTGTTHLWLLQWGDEHLPREHHFKFQGGNNVLSLSLAGLLADFRAAIPKYVGDLTTQADLQTNYDLIEAELKSYELRVI